MSAFGYLFAWRFVRLLPEPLAYKFFTFLGRRFHKSNGKQIKRLRSNLARVKKNLSPEDMENLVAQGVESYFRYWCDTFRLPDWNHERIQSTVTCDHEELLLNPMRDGRGVIVALPHAGNWDHAGAYFCGKGFPLVTVAEQLKPERLFKKFLSYREAIGMEVLPLDSRAMPKLLQRAREGKLIALVADRDLSQSGVAVEFFGEKAKMPPGPALLAVRTGVPLISAFVSYREKGIHIEFTSIPISDLPTEPERINATTQEISNIFEDAISRYPEDWHMLQRIWLDGN